MSDPTDEDFLEEIIADLPKLHNKLLAALKSLELPDGPKAEELSYGVFYAKWRVPFGSVTETTDVLKTLAKGKTAAKQVKDLFLTLPDSIQYELEDNSLAIMPQLADSEPDVPGDRRDMVDLLEALEQDFATQYDLMKINLEAAIHEIDPNRLPGAGGRRPKLESNLVALKVGEIFIALRGELPTTGTNYDGGPSTLFARIVSEVFNILSIDEEFRKPCQRAVSILKSSIPHSTLPSRDNNSSK